LNPCFLCSPEANWVYARSGSFYSMLGLGPVVEGYSLLATTDHTKSMLDLSEAEVEELIDFTQYTRKLLSTHYGDSIITEHGRVAPCVGSNRDRQQTHCFHAHRLIFPTSADLTEAISNYGLEVQEYSNFREGWSQFSWTGEYLYFERADGSCLIAGAPMRSVRQFFRHKVAELMGQPEVANWSEYPQLRVLEAARRRLLPEG
jgi:diadenosine tetraphosphate (Ap4A) HIT family hydrolase